jgi:rfaE bifunctional protein kinase chain/domain
MRQPAELFKAFEQLTVLVIGDVMIDRYLYGSVERISPEAPVPVVHMQREENRLGGAANVALNIAALGAKSILCTVVGTDENGDQFLDLLPTHQLSSEGVIRSDERPTTVKTRVIAQSQQLMRVDREETHDLSSEESSKFLDNLSKIIDNQYINLIILQDYNKGVLSESVIQAIIALAKKKSIPTAVDPKKKNFWSYRGASLFKPNLKEVRDSLPFPVAPTLESLGQAASAIREKLNNEYTLITLSEKGMYWSDTQEGHLVPTRPRSIADVCGAGDTVISVAALAYAAGLEMQQAVQLANLAGGQVCERVGVVPVDRNQLEVEFQELFADTPQKS